MAQPYLRHGRWYLKYKDAGGRWRDKVCDARTKAQAAALLCEIKVAEDRARNGLEARPGADGGGTVDELIKWWVEKHLSKKPSYHSCIGTIRRHLLGSPLGKHRLCDVTPGSIEELLAQKAADCSPETVN